MSPPALDSAPRIAALPGPSRLVRISEGTWQDLRHRLSPADSPAADVPDPRNIAELERTGLLVDGDIEPHWRAALSAAPHEPRERAPRVRRPGPRLDLGPPRGR